MNNNEKQQNSNKDNTPKMPKRPKMNVYWIYGAIALLFIGMQFFGSMGSSLKETTWKDFKSNMLEPKDVEKVVVVNKEKVEVYIKPGKLGTGKYQEFNNDGFSSGPHYYFTIGSVEYFEKQMDEAQKDFSEEENNYNPPMWFMTIFVLLLFASLTYFASLTAILARIGVGRSKSGNSSSTFCMNTL